MNASNVSRPKILIVDDDDFVLHTLRRTLSKQADVETCSDGAAATVALRSASFDILMCDLVLPDTEGLLLIQEAQRDQPLIAPIIITGFPDLDTAVEGLRAGAYDYLIKPIEPELVVAVVGRAWEKISLTRERDALLQELRQKNTVLEAQTAELRLANAALLQTAKLRKDKAEAEAECQFRTRFLARMSHELRTPMHAILGLTELLTQTELDDKQQGYLERVSGAGESLLAMIDDVLDFSQTDLEAAIETDTVFSLEDLIGDVVGALRPNAAAKGLSVELSFENVPQLHAGDPRRLAQVLRHLVDNAIKFTPAGTVWVRARGLEGGQPGKIRFEVQDTGVGIEPGYLERVFELFTQRDDSRTRTHDGVGIGLAIAHRIVSVLGGKIEVESVVGAGSQFAFTVVLREATGIQRASG